MNSEEVLYPWSASHSMDIFILESAVGIGELPGLRVGFAVGIHGDGSDLLLRLGTVIAISLDRSNGINHIHAGGDLTESGVLSVQVLGVRMHDEELAAGRVWRGRTGHAQNAPLVLQIVFHTVEEKLTLDAVAGAAHTGALGAAALDHEAGNDPVEDQAVIVIVIAQVDEIADTLRGFVRVQLTADDAAVFHGDGKSRIHINISPSWPGRSDAWRPGLPRPVVYHIVFCPYTGQP